MDWKAMGKRIKAAREASGMTQEELADAINMSSMHISVIERGVKPPKLETFIQIANILHVSADEILEDVIECAIPARANRLSDLLEDLPQKEQKCLLNSLESFINSFNQQK